MRSRTRWRNPWARPDAGRLPGPVPAAVPVPVVRPAARYAAEAAAPGPELGDRWVVNESVRWSRPVRASRLAIGHLYMWSLLRVHAVVGDGVADALGELTMRDVAQAVAASRYFGLAELADLLVRVPQAAASATAARAFDEEYRGWVESGDRLLRAIRRTIAARPEDFPVEVV